MATLDRDDIEAIADAVVRRLGMDSGVNLATVAETMTLAERKAFWAGKRKQQKGGERNGQDKTNR